MRASPFKPLPLPVRDGVSPSVAALPEDGPWRTVAEYFIERFAAIPAETWMRRIADGELVDEHGVTVTRLRRFEPRLRIYYYRQLDDEPRVPFEAEVLHLDEHLLVADKPHFLPVAPVGKYVQETLLVRLKRQLAIDTLVPLHRIDRETAGLVMFSVRPETRGVYHALFSERRMHKRYEAVVPWSPGFDLPAVRRSRLGEDSHFMCMRELPGEPNAETRFELIEHADRWARLGLSPVSGRRHQLRVHCAAIGLPIRHDAIYPVLKPEGENDFERPLQLLARSLDFIDPVSGQARRFESRRHLQPLG